MAEQVGYNLPDIRNAVNQNNQQIENLIIENGNSNAEIVAARTDPSGKTYKTIGARIDDETVQLDQKLDKGSVSVYDIDKNKGKIDQTYLSDDLLNQITGDAPINATPAPDSVTTDILAPKSVDHLKTDAYVPLVYKTRPRNLFNKEDVTDGYYVSRQNGELVADPTFFATDYIRVSGGLHYCKSNLAHGAWYDKDRKYISGIQYSSTTDLNPLTAPVNAKFVRFSTDITNKNIFMIVEDSVLGEYEPYYTELKVKADEILSDSSITDDLLAIKAIRLSTKNTNLFDKGTVTPNSAISRYNGEITENADFVASDYITVKGGSRYKQTHLVNTGAWYDVDRVFISGILYDSSNQPISAPQNAQYVRISVPNAEVSSHMFIEGDALPDKYVPYYKEVGDSLIEQQSMVLAKLQTPSEIARDVLNTPGSIIALIGDSITHGMGGTGFAEDGDLIPGTTVRTNPNGHCWANSLRDLLQSKYNVTVKNFGQSGMNSSQLLPQLETLSNQGQSLVIMQLGTNDRHNLTSIEETKKYQRQSVDFFLSRGIKVILMSAVPEPVEQENDPKRYFGMFDVDKAISELASEYGMEHISNYDAVLQFSEYRDINSDTLLADGLHPNDAGYDVMFRHIVRKLGMSYVRPGVTK